MSDNKKHLLAMQNTQPDTTNLDQYKLKLLFRALIELLHEFYDPLCLLMLLPCKSAEFMLLVPCKLV